MHLGVCSFVTGKPTTALGTHDPGLRSEERRMDWTLQMKGTRLQQVAIFQNISEGWIELCRWRGLDFNRLQYFKIFPPPRHKLLSWPFWTVRGRRCRHSRKLSNRFVARDDIIRFVLKAKDDLLQGIRYCKVGKHSIDRAARAPQQPTKMAGKQCPAGRVFQYQVGSGRVLNKIPGSGWGLGRVRVSKNTIRYFRVPFFLSGISGYVRYFWVFLGLPIYTKVIF